MHETKVQNLDVIYTQRCETKHPVATIVFLHGWGGSAKSWEQNTAELSKSFDCVSLELPGFGISSIPDSVWGVQEYAQFLKDFIQKLNIVDFVLIGKSFGGRVAIKYAHNWPKTLRGLVLVSAAGLERKSFATKTKIASAKVGRSVLSFLGPKAVELLRKTFYSLASIEKDRSDYKWEVKKKVTNTDLTREAAQIATPTLIIWGEDDKILLPSVGKKLSKLIKSSTFQIITGTHNAHQESFEKFNFLVACFIKGLKR